MIRPRHINRTKGLTLLEMMIAMAIFTIGVLSVIGIFTGIARSLHTSKSRTLASNLAQEKIESLKNLSYYRLLVTTSTTLAPEASIGGYYYDDGYYPPETMSVGDIQFTRRVYIQKVTETGGALVDNAWYEADTGLKKITTYVLWKDGQDWKQVSVSNVRDNPNRQKIDSVLTGTVRSGGVAVQDVTVFALQNVSLKAVTNTSGVYTINVPSGTYDLKASKRSYFPLTLSVTVNSGATATKDFDLTAKLTGTVTASAFVNKSLVISEICSAVNGDPKLEYVELYNPTENSFTLSTGLGTANYLINFSNKADGSVTAINPLDRTKYVNTVIPAHGYFLFGSSAIVNGVTADAYYSDNVFVNNVPEDRIPINVSGGVALVSLGSYEASGSTVDAIGWGKSGGSPYGPANAREGSGFRMTAGAGSDGFAADEVLERMALSSSTDAGMDVFPVPGIHSLAGNAYDTDDNSVNWIHHTHTDDDVPQNTSVFEAPQSGKPAGYAVAFMDDGLSGSVQASSTGTFTITSVATGTWSILASSSGWVYTNSTVTVTAGATTNLGTIYLNSSSIQGYISGRVMTSGSVPMSSILVTAGGATDLTDSNGVYWLPVDAGTYTVTANPDNSNSLYTVGMTSEVVVGAAALTNAADITLYQGGILKGFISANGTDPLPGIPIISTNSSGAEVGSAISDSLGRFTFADLPVGTYTLTPQLDSGETASPTQVSSAVVSGSTVFVGTFTIRNAYGSVQGTVKTTAGTSIKTGVLIMAVSTGTSVGTNPPTMTSTVRNGSTVYYLGTSEADGTYTLSLRGGINYDVYAWYSTFVAGVPVVTKKSSTNVVVSAGGTSTVNFTW